MPSVGEQADHLDARNARDRERQVDRRSEGRSAQAVEASVDLHEDGYVASDLKADAADALCDLDGVEAHANGGAFAQCAQTRELRLPPDRERDEEIGLSRLDHDLRLAELGDRDTARARIDLQLCDLGALVRLRVRPQPHAGVARHLRHLRDVRLHHVEI